MAVKYDDKTMIFVIHFTKNTLYIYLIFDSMSWLVIYNSQSITILVTKSVIASSLVCSNQSAWYSTFFAANCEKSIACLLVNGGEISFLYCLVIHKYNKRIIFSSI